MISITVSRIVNKEAKFEYMSTFYYLWVDCPRFNPNVEYFTIEQIMWTVQNG